jgi:hypothetical protein
LIVLHGCLGTDPVEANNMVPGTNPTLRHVYPWNRERRNLCAINALGAPSISGGIAGTFMITFENGWTLFFGGSSAATMDQALWAELYKPDAAILHMGAAHKPMDYALMVRLLQTNNPNL